MRRDESLLADVESIKNLLVSHATGERADDIEFRKVRARLLKEPLVRERLPKCVVTCRTLSEFWGFIKPMFGTYAQRREFLRTEFDAVLTFLEARIELPFRETAESVLSRVDSTHVHGAWQKALERRETDPEGAITAARTLVESVCKHILDDEHVEYPDDVDLPKLYRLVAERLLLAPSQHTEDVFKRILGGCQAAVEGLASVRNRLSDSHGKGRHAVKPQPRHAELAVNLAGAISVFLVSTLEARRKLVL